LSRPWSASDCSRTAPCCWNAAGMSSSTTARSVQARSVTTSVGSSWSPSVAAEEPSGCPGIAKCRYVDVDDLAALIDRAVHVTPPAGDLHRGLVHKPCVPDAVPAGPGCVGEERRESLHPPVHGHVVDLDPPLGQELFDVAVATDASWS
jgi:hypothetical protein